MSRFLILSTLLWMLVPGCSSVGAQDPSAINRVVAQCQPKMAKVIGAGAGRVDGYGSGFIVSPDGLILTSQGVYLDGSQVKVELSDGNSYPATILRRNRTLQLALLKIDPERELDFFPLSDGPVGEKGDFVIAISNAFKVADKSEPLSAMIGIVSLRTSMEAWLNKRDVAYRGPLVLIDAITSNPGASGGVVVDVQGNAVGMIGKLINSSETNTRINYAVPASTLLAFVENRLENLEDESVAGAAELVASKPATLGIVLFSAGGRKDPAYIDRVKRGSPAAKLRLRPDDLIISVDGVQTATVADFEAAVAKMVPGQKVMLLVKRGSGLLRAEIVPVEK